MTSKIILLFLVACFIVILVTRKYISRIRLKTSSMLTWKHEYSDEQLIDAAKDNSKNEFSFCKNIETREIQVT